LYQYDLQMRSFNGTSCRGRENQINLQTRSV
jgi:hypothetical protein